MDEQTILRAKLLSAVFCRAIEFHAVVSTMQTVKTPEQLTKFVKNKDDCEAAVTVALENLLDIDESTKGDKQ